MYLHIGLVATKSIVHYLMPLVEHEDFLIAEVIHFALIIDPVFEHFIMAHDGRLDSVLVCHITGLLEAVMMDEQFALLATSLLARILSHCQQ